MQPQGTAPVNLTYFTSVVSQINGLVSQFQYIQSGNFGKDIINEVQQQLLTQLQGVANQIMPDMQAQLTGMQTQLQTLEAMVPLATMSISDLPSVISFVTGFQTASLLPAIKPYTTLITQLTQLASQIGSLVSALNSAASALGGTVNVPVVTSSIGYGAAAGVAVVAGTSA